MTVPTNPADTQNESWQCVCGETDVSKHDLGMVIAHEYELPEEKGREILMRVRRRLGINDDN